MNRKQVLWYYTFDSYTRSLQDALMVMAAYYFWKAGSSVEWVACFLSALAAFVVCLYRQTTYMRADDLMYEAGKTAEKGREVPHAVPEAGSGVGGG